MSDDGCVNETPIDEGKTKPTDFLMELIKLQLCKSTSIVPTKILPEPQPVKSVIIFSPSSQLPIPLTNSPTVSPICHSAKTAPLAILGRSRNARPSPSPEFLLPGEKICLEALTPPCRYLFFFVTQGATIPALCSNSP
jgi:hypothetical protein